MEVISTFLAQKKCAICKQLYFFSLNPWITGKVSVLRSVVSVVLKSCEVSGEKAIPHLVSHTTALFTLCSWSGEYLLMFSDLCHLVWGG